MLECLCNCRRYVRTPDPSEEVEEEEADDEGGEEEDEDEEELYKTRTNGVTNGVCFAV